MSRYDFDRCYRPYVNAYGSCSSNCSSNDGTRCPHESTITQLKHDLKECKQQMQQLRDELARVGSLVDLHLNFAPRAPGAVEAQAHFDNLATTTLDK